MTAALCRASLAIRVFSDVFPFHEGYLHGPAIFRNTMVRQYVHEVLHFWQLFGSGYLANLAAQEWSDVQSLELGNPCPGDRLSLWLRDFREAPDGLPFSTWNLHEALCRFWDIQMIGAHNLLDPSWGQEPFYPTSEEELRAERRKSDQVLATGADFDAVVAQLMLDRDIYAGPYQRMLETVGSVEAVRLFPLMGYFALQTSEPVRVFQHSLEILMNEAPRRSSLAPLTSIHTMWRADYTEVREVCAIAAFCTTGRSLTPGWEVIRRAPLASHPVYGWYAAMVARPPFRTARPRIDEWLATPGDPEHRGRLIAMMRPPLVLFNDGQRWTSALPSNSAKLRAEYAELADSTEKCDERCRDWELVLKHGITKRPQQAASSSHPRRATWRRLQECPDADLKATFSDCCERGDAHNAARVWRAFRGRTPSPEAALTIHRLLRQQDGDRFGPPQAESLHDAAASGDPDIAPWAGTRIAEELEEHGHSEASMPIWHEVLSSGHPYYAAKAALALGWAVDDSEPEHACDLYRRALGLRHRDLAPQAACLMGAVLMRMGRAADALDAYRAAMRFEHPDLDPEAAFNLGHLYYRMGRISAARVAFNRSRSSRHPEFWWRAQQALFEIDA